MEQLVISDFVLEPDLANALAQAKKLSVLVLVVKYCTISDIINTSKSLSMFHIYYCYNEQGVRNPGRKFVSSASEARMAAKSLRENAAEDGRAVDVTIVHSKFPVRQPILKTWFPSRQQF